MFPFLYIGSQHAFGFLGFSFPVLNIQGLDTYMVPYCPTSIHSNGCMTIYFKWRSSMQNNIAMSSIQKAMLTSLLVIPLYL